MPRRMHAVLTKCNFADTTTTDMGRNVETAVYVASNYLLWCRFIWAYVIFVVFVGFGSVCWWPIVIRVS